MKTKNYERKYQISYDQRGYYVEPFAGCRPCICDDFTCGLTMDEVKDYAKINNIDIKGIDYYQRN